MPALATPVPGGVEVRGEAYKAASAIDPRGRDSNAAHGSAMPHFDGWG